MNDRIEVILLFGRICSGKSSYMPNTYRVTVSNLVRGIIATADRNALQNTMHLHEQIAEAIIKVIDSVSDREKVIIVDGIRQVQIVEKVLEHHPYANMIWLEVPTEERKRRYEARKDAKDVEPFDIADNKKIELEGQEIYSIFKERIKVICNY